MMNILYIDSDVDRQTLIEKIELASKAKGIDLKIMAFGDVESIGYLSDVDIICIAPQIRYLQQTMNERVSDDTPVMVIDTVSYQRKRGNTVLDDVLGILKNKRGEKTWKSLQHGWKNTSFLSLQKLVHKSI